MVITEKSYADALDRVVEIIERRKPSLDVNNIVIVPDVYTFALEKRLFSRGKGAGLSTVPKSKAFSRADKTSEPSSLTFISLHPPVLAAMRLSDA